MQLTQLQALIQECKRIIKSIQKHKTEQASRKKERTELKKKIRERRIELPQLQFQIKHNKMVKKQVQEIVKLNGLLRKQLNNCLSLNSKQLISYEKVFGMASNMQQQVNGLDMKIINIQNEIEQSQRNKVHFKHQYQALVVYQELKKQFQFKAAQMKRQSLIFSNDFTENEGKIHQINARIQQLDLSYQELCEKVAIQLQIIENIKESELLQPQTPEQKPKFKTEVDQFESSKSNYFKSKEQLNFIQKIQVQSILMRQQFKKEQEYSMMGYIAKQNIKAAPKIGRIINNRYKFNYDSSDIRKIGQLQARTQSFDKKANFDFLNSSDRLKRLQVNKRIRTRQTDFKRYSQHFKNVLLEDLEEKCKIEPLPSSNIVKIYTDMKKNQPTKHKIGQIEIFKIVKSDNKRKYVKSHRGRGLQLGDQNSN